MLSRTCSGVPAAVVAVVIVAVVSHCSAQTFSECFPDSSVRTSPANVFNFTGVNSFGLDLFRRLSPLAVNSNLVMSPYSIWSALSLALMGASGNTRKQLEQALGLPSTKLGAYRTKYVLDFVLSAAGSGEGGKPEILKTDKALFDTSLNVKPCTSHVISNIETVNFRDANVAGDINEDISIATRGHIRELISPSKLANSVFLLLNAIYFRGDWAKPFQKDATYSAPFFGETGRQVDNVQMMFQQNQFPIVIAPALKATVLELPYNNSNVSMLVMLPDDSIEETLRNLNPFTLNNALGSSIQMPVKVHLPKFNLETQMENDLIDNLKRMGITDMFSPINADFTDFTTSLPPIFADTVIHKSIVRVDEVGTVAAGVTAIFGTRKGPGRAVEFKADRPFVFMIYEKRVKVALFTGIVNNPNV